ncbi:MAG TPA: PASTA domain-containing protein [Nitrospirota bacterium]
MKRFLKGLALFIALVGVGIVSAFAVVALLLRQEEVRAPDLTGQDIVNVIDITTRQGLLLKVERREPHPTLPRDTVISQSPAPGSGIKKGRQIRVVVSQGPSEMTAPKLVGENFRKADIMIRQAGFSPGDVSRVYSDTIERDTVIAQAPQAGNPIDRNGRISFLVSAGRRPPVFVMPKLAGRSTAEAAKAIERIGLQYRLISRPSATRTQPEDRTVVSQKPGAGHPVTADATVELVVGK